MRVMLTIYFLSIMQACFAQVHTGCKCPKSEFVSEVTPYKIFYFSGAKAIAITTAPDTFYDSGRRDIYSEFSIYECGSDTTIRFYGATERCKIDFAKDTLVIERMEQLAIGKSYEFVDTPWIADRYYYRMDRLQMQSEVLAACRYNEEAIKNTLQVYEHTQWSTQIGSDSAKSEQMLSLANRLMLAAISGNATAKEYFAEFEKKFKPDGAYAEWYDDMAAMIEIAEQLKGIETNRIH